MKERFFRLAGSLAFATSLWLTSVPVRGGEFINLGFNDPDLSNAHYDVDRTVTVAPVQEVLRGWSVVPLPAELPYGGLIGVGGSHPPPFGLNAAAPEQVGTFGAYLLGMNGMALNSPSSPPRPAITLSQTATIPADAALLRYFESGAFSQIEVYLSGVRQTATILDTTLTMKGIDVSAMAGTEVTMEFRFPEGQFSTFDILGFEPVPEPTTWLLAMIGGVGLLVLRRRR